MRKRKAAIIASANGVAKLARTELDAAVAEQGRVGWGNRQQKELDFVRMKPNRDRLLAMLEGSVLPNEISPEEAALASELKKHARKLRGARERAAKRTLATVAPKSHVGVQVAFAGARIFFEADVADCERLIVKAGGVPVKDPDAMHTCNIWIVADVAKPGSLVRWTAAVLGGHIITAAFLASSGSRGPSIAYAAALKTPRSIWMSRAFQAAYHYPATVVQTACASKGSRWKLLHSKCACAEHAMRAVNRGRPMDTLALVSDAESRSAAMSSIRNVCSCDGAWHLLRRPDTVRSFLGACGM